MVGVVAVTASVPLYRLPSRQRRVLGAAGLQGTVMAFLDAHTPTVCVGGDRVTHACLFDVAIVGNNILLAALAAKTAVDAGLSVLVAGAFGMEGFPVGLAEDAAFRTVAAKLAGAPGDLREALGAAFTAAVHVTRHPVDFTLWDTEETAVLQPVRSTKTVSVPDPVSSSVRKRAETVCPRMAFPLRGRRRSVVIASVVLVTSALPELSLQRAGQDDPDLTDWQHPQVIGFGTARRNDRLVGDAVTAILDDMAEIVSGRWLPTRPASKATRARSAFRTTP